MSLTDGERLRELLGESIPVGGDEDDTNFTDEQIDDILERFPDLYEGVAEGWRILAGQFAKLVNTNESGTSRSMSDLHRHALEMNKFYSSGSVETPVTEDRRRVKIKSIVRPDETR